MALVTLNKEVGVNFSNFMLWIYQECVSGAITQGVPLEDISQEAQDACTLECFTNHLTVKMVGGYYIEAYNVFDFIDLLAKDVAAGGSCSYTPLQWHRVMPDIYGYILLEVDYNSFNISEHPLDCATLVDGYGGFGISANGAVNYIWEVDKKDGSGWVPVTTWADPASDYIELQGVLVAEDGDTFRCTIEDGAGGSITSNPAVLTQNATKTTHTIMANEYKPDYGYSRATDDGDFTPFVGVGGLMDYIGSAGPDTLEIRMGTTGDIQTPAVSSIEVTILGIGQKIVDWDATKKSYTVEWIDIQSSLALLKNTEVSVTLELVEPTNPDPDGTGQTQTLLVNGDFEDGLDGWTLSRSVAEIVDGKCHYTSYDKCDRHYSVGQAIPVEKGYVYEVTFEIFNDSILQGKQVKLRDGRRPIGGYGVGKHTKYYKAKSDMFNFNIKLYGDNTTLVSLSGVRIKKVE